MHRALPRQTAAKKSLASFNSGLRGSMKQWKESKAELIGPSQGAFPLQLLK